MKYRYRKITPENIGEMKILRKQGFTYRDIAEIFNVRMGVARYHLIPKEKEYKINQVKKYHANLTNKQKKEKTKKQQPYMKKYMNDRYNNDEEFRKSFIEMVQKNFKKRREKWILKGLCNSCGRKRINKKFVLCEKCREVCRKKHKKEL